MSCIYIEQHSTIHREKLRWKWISNQMEVNMINFDEEITKFQPSLEVDQAEDVINNNDLSDITDIIKTMLKDLKDN